MLTKKLLSSVTCIGIILTSACELSNSETQEAVIDNQESNSPPIMEQHASIDDHGPDDHLIYTPEEIHWQDGPGSLEEGAQYAILEGDPGEAGVFTMRIRMPDGFHIAPHWHPNVERVTVLSGTFRLGSGEEADIQATMALEPGSYTSMPPEMRHFAYAQGETIIQLTSVGPWVINYIHPADDPRNR